MTGADSGGRYHRPTRSDTRLEAITIVEVVLTKARTTTLLNRHPNRTAPVGVAAEHSAVDSAGSSLTALLLAPPSNTYGCSSESGKARAGRRGSRIRFRPEDIHAGRLVRVSMECGCLCPHSPRCSVREAAALHVPAVFLTHPTGCTYSAPWR